MQGDTYQQEKQLEMIWSPQRDKGGHEPHSWLRMTEIQEGDRIFHYVKGNIVAMSMARENCKSAGKPDDLQNLDGYNDDSYIVHLNYHELDHPVNIRDHFHEISPLLPIKYSPFQQDGMGNPGYLYPCNEELAIKLLEMISELNIYLTSEEQLEFAIDAIKVTEHNTLIPLIAETELEVKTKIRLGQQNFRKKLLPLWEGKCALCGIDLPDLLIASHSKPWKDSSNDERLDPFNGVLLCRNHNALYKNGFIAFDVQGRTAISSTIVQEDYLKYRLEADSTITIHPENKKYFRWHLKNVFRESFFDQ